MSYSYKTVLRRENYDFDVYKNKYNSRLSGIIAINRHDHNVVIDVGFMDNKTHTVSITDKAENYFQPSTIHALRKNLSS